MRIRAKLRSRPTVQPPITLVLALVAACGGGGTAKVRVDLKVASDPMLSPFETGTLSKIRVSLKGTEQYDDAAIDLPITARSAVFDSYPSNRTIQVRVEGFDALGNLVAFGRAQNVSTSGDASVSIPFRRNLAYVTHSPNPRQNKPGNAIYVIDLASRTYVGTLRVPGNGIARNITARGGLAMLVPYDEGGRGFLGVLSADDHQWTSIPLSTPQDIAVAVPDRNIAIVAGGGSVTLVDLDNKDRRIIAEFPVGGNGLAAAMAASGKKAIVLVSLSPGMVAIDLTDNCLKSLQPQRCIRALSAVQSPAGIALAGDGRSAYVTSSANRSVAVVDLERLEVTPLNQAGFAAPVGAAAYSDAMQAVLAVQSGMDGPPRVLGFVVGIRKCAGTQVNGRCDGELQTGESLSLADATPTYPFPRAIAADPSGHRLVVVAAGSSTATAGLTVIETAARTVPIGSSGLYPSDPTDTFTTRAEGFVGHQRYQPNSVGVLYGR